MNLRTQLIHIADIYCAHRNRSRSRVSTIIFNAGKTLDRVAEGADLTTANWEKAIAWFDKNWPEDLLRPAGLRLFANIIGD